MTEEVEIDVGSIRIKFPREPYPVQVEYMTRVIECLTEAKFGLLESPTGTGKTLSLLCASLAWIRHFKVAQQVSKLSGGKLEPDLWNPSAFWGPRPKIIYASRTHSQLSQVIEEFGRTAYKDVPNSVLGSRDQLCINASVASTTLNVNRNALCRSKVKQKSCEFYNNLEKRVKEDEDGIQQPNEVIINDIETLKSKGLKQRICPYYWSRNICGRAEIIFMPYNYLFDAKIRKTLSVDLEGSVIILDEAHNVLQRCEESNSLRFEAKDIAVAITELDFVVGCIENDSANESDSTTDFTVPEVLMLKEILCKFETLLIDLDCSNKDFDGNKVFELLGASGAGPGAQLEIKALLDKLDEFLASANILWGSAQQQRGKGLNVFGSLMDLVYQNPATASLNVEDLLKTFFKLYVEKDNKKNVIFNLWCFSPGFCMKSLIETGVRSIILTSGTLKPIGSFQSELCTEFPVKLQSGHVIKDDQLFVRVLTRGVDKTTPLSSSFRTRSDPKYLNSLGATILKLFRAIPDGILIFFPSYSVMNSCVDFWQTGNSFWTALNSVKPVFIEPKVKGILPKVIGDFRKAVRENKGAALMAVCRGKVAEGIDFADADARAVIVTGIPYPNVMDARIALKRKYLDFQRSLDSSRTLTGNEWYNLEAFRSVNQTIGRVIRHKDDYGAILFLDQRFSNVKAHLSDWVQTNFKVANDFETTLSDLSSFFGSSKQNHPVKAPKLPPHPTKSQRPKHPSSPPPLLNLKRKKIVIKPREFLEEDKVSDPQTPTELAAELVKKLKKSLSKEELLDFRSKVKDYKTNDSDFRPILGLMNSEWFRHKMTPEEKAKFKCFIKEKDHQKYDLELVRTNRN